MGRFTFIFFSTPFAISSSVSFTLILRLLPFTRRCPPPPKPPPKPEKPPPPPPNAPPKISPNWLKVSSIFIPPRQSRQNHRKLGDHIDRNVLSFEDLLKLHKLLQ